MRDVQYGMVMHGTDMMDGTEYDGSGTGCVTRRMAQ